MNPEIHLRWPAITCVHVLLMGAPVLFVSHNEPVCEDDSGWSFTCGQEGHPNEEGMVVAIGTVLEQDPGVEDVLLLPEGYFAWRDGINEEWQIERL